MALGAGICQAGGWVFAAWWVGGYLLPGREGGTKGGTLHKF